MCGITGIVNLHQPRRVGLPLIARMTGVIRHRGPEESGVYVDDWAALGHARLSIIDLAGGGQPIHNEDRTLWIVYNGEVFNYPELRRDLEARGHRFYTTTDTEVILHLYEEKGEDCLGELNGQFALAIWDAPRRRLLLARDRLGICPLHYAFHDGRLIFGSEVKAIFTYPGMPRRLDPAALGQICNFWTTLPGHSAFAGVHELPAGHCLVVDEDRCRLRRYWEIPAALPDEHLRLSEEEITQQIRDLLVDAVRIRLRADVPVGCYLSGGLDSSGIAAIVARGFNGGVRTFGMRFEEKRFDEGEYQDQMVNHLGVEHQALWLANETIGATLREALWHIEKPLLRTAPVPLFLLSGLVRQSGYKVVLTGEGSDEIFGGYNIFRETKVRRFWARQPDSAWRSRLIGRLYPYIFDDPKLLPMLTGFFGKGLEQTDDPFYSHAIRWANTGRIAGFLTPEVRAGFDPAAAREQLLALLPAHFGALDYLGKAQYLETLIFLSNYLLTSQGDRVAMAHSVEIRIPFLDHRLVELMGRVPSRLKIRGLTEKYILRRVLRDWLPAPIIQRNKHPYRAPIQASLLTGKGWDALQDLVGEPALREAGVFDPARVARLIQKMRTSPSPSEVDNMALIAVISTQALYEHFVTNFPEPAGDPPRPEHVFEEGSAKPEKELMIAD